MDNAFKLQGPNGAPLKLYLKGHLGLTSGEISFWYTATFAHLWYADAVREAKNAESESRRREIIFSVTAVESYLFEWVRDEILKQNFNDIGNYFKLNNHNGIERKWKEVPKKLKLDGRIHGLPDLSGKTWNQFTMLIKFRNGLVHASFSRPENLNPSSKNSCPSPRDLLTLPPGWAVRVVFDLINELNQATGTRKPDWLNHV